MESLDPEELLARGQRLCGAHHETQRLYSILVDFQPLLLGVVTYEFREEEPFYVDGPFGRLTAEEQVSLAVWGCRRYLTDSGFTECEEEALDCLNEWLAKRSDEAIFDLMFHSDIVDYTALDGDFTDREQRRMFLVSDCCELARCIEEQGTVNGGGGWTESFFFDIYNHYREALGETQPWNVLFLAWLLGRIEAAGLEMS